jgi:hypothetical protein
MPRARASLRKNRSDLFHGIPAEKFALVVSTPHIPFRQSARCTHLRDFGYPKLLGQRTIGQRGRKARSSRKVARNARTFAADLCSNKSPIILCGQENKFCRLAVHVVRPVLVDPGAEAGRAELKGHGATVPGT